MSTPVITDKWAGNFDCSVCRRKRLVGDEFSKKVRIFVVLSRRKRSCVLRARITHLSHHTFLTWQALERHRKTGGPLKCKKCVAEVEEKERKAAAASKPALASSDETRACAKCKQSLKADAFNKNQWNKGEGKARCRSCVEQSLADEAAQQTQSKSDAIQKAKDDVEAAKKSGNAQAILKTESVLAALEAEKVTGLKPVKMGRGRGRGSGRGRGRSSRR